MDFSPFSPEHLHRRLENSVAASKMSAVMIGKLLLQLKQDDNYREAVGEGVEGWQAYLAQPEIGLSVSEANRLTQIYEVFALRHGIDEDELAAVPIKNLHTLLPFAKGLEDSEEVAALVNDARHLSQRDFKERLHDVKSQDDGVRTYEYVIMQKCIETGGLRKVHDFSPVDVDTMIQRYRDES